MGDRPVRETFPANLMLEGKQALVVGGGRVGLRKVELLLDAGASVVLVCPEWVSELEELPIERRKRIFEASDLTGQTLVFACTDDKHVNRAILSAARDVGVMCCCSDGNWAEADFTTPAILRTDQLIISISTGGRSCRQAKLVKDNLKRHLDAISSTDLVVLGTSHEQLGLREREPYHLPLPDRERLGDMIRQIWGVHEFMILNTCNRVEVLAAVSKDAGTSGILRRLLRFDCADEGNYYFYRGFDAFAHVCEVVAGMRSQVPGEVHIVSQLKEAAEEALAFGWAGSLISEWRDSALRVSREVRQETETLLAVSEIEEVAVDWILENRPEVDGAVAVIGTGPVGKGLIARFRQEGRRCVWVYHANKPDVSDVGIEVVQLADLESVINRVQLLVSAVNVREPVVKHAPKGILLVDLGVPANIAPELQPVDLDTLKNWQRRRTGHFEEAVLRSNKVIERNRAAYERLRLSVQGELKC